MFLASMKLSAFTAPPAGSLPSWPLPLPGNLYTWGYNANRQLGDGTAVNKSSPVLIGSVTPWQAVAESTCGFGIKTDGTLWAWGPNGLVSALSSPVQVGSLTSWRSISETCAIKTDGTLWGWGTLSGNGTNVNQTSLFLLRRQSIGKSLSLGLTLF